MRFTQKIKAPAGQTTVVPRDGFGDPDDIPRLNTFIAGADLLNSGTAPRRTLIALEGNAGDSAEVRIWVLDDAGFGNPEINPDMYAGTEWYELLPAPVSLTVGVATEAPPLPEGRVYIQVSTGPLSDAVVKVGSAP